jgi:nitronate monooxygenase
LGAAYLGDLEEGVFISGANGYRLKEQGIIPVKELIRRLVEGE